MEEAAGEMDVNAEKRAGEGEKETGANAVFTGGVWNLARIEVRNRYGELPVSGCEDALVPNVDESRDVPEPPKPIVKRGKMKRVGKKDWKMMDTKCFGSCMDECCDEDIGLEVFVGQVETDKQKLGIRFQVVDVIKPLISVKRLTEKGNKVCFGPEEEDNYIEHKESKNRVGLKQTLVLMVPLI